MSKIHDAPLFWLLSTTRNYWNILQISDNYTLYPVFYFVKTSKKVKVKTRRTQRLKTWLSERFQRQLTDGLMHTVSKLYSSFGAIFPVWRYINITKIYTTEFSSFLLRMYTKKNSRIVDYVIKSHCVFTKYKLFVTYLLFY